MIIRFTILTRRTLLLRVFGSCFMLLFICMANAQSSNDYRTNGNVDFASATNWERYDGSSWIAATSAPSSSDNVITIRNGHTATVTADISLDQVVVESGGTITVDPSVKLTIATNINHGITFKANGIVNGAGDFELSNHSKLTTANPNGITASGASGSVQVTGTRTYSPTGIYEYNGTSAQVTGDGLPTTVFGLYINNSAGVTASNNITITRLLELQAGDLDMNGKHLTINSTATMTCNTNVVTGSGSNFNLFSSATLKTAHPLGITASDALGSIQVTGTRSYSSSARYEYNGTSAQNTGDGLPSTLNSELIINNSAGVTASQSITISTSGTLKLQNGNLTVNFSDVLDINGTIECNFSQVNGTGNFTLHAGATFKTKRIDGVDGSIITSNKTFNTANYVFENPSANQNANFPTLVTTIDNLTINTGASNYVSLNQNMNVNGLVNLVSGDLNLNGKNILLGTSGNINENLSAQHIIKDLTATTDMGVKGGYIEATNRTVDNTSGNIAGLGIFLRTANPGDNYSDLQVRRYHYTAGNGVGIRLVYEPSSSSISSKPTTIGFRFPVAEENPNGLTLNSIYKWSSGTGWQAIPSTISCTSPTCDICTNTAQTSFSSWSLGNNSNAQLPITLLSFDAKRIGQTPEVLLQWRTAQEINNKGFEIEFSPDMQTFTTLAFIDGAGNTTTPRTYEWKVINPTAGYYRLKQIDFNQTLSYSGVVFVKGFDNSHAITLMPNPSNEYLNLTLPLAGNETAWLTICDLHGKVIWQGSTQGDLQWNVSNWANGVYLLQVRTSQGVQYRKFVVNK